MTDDLVKRLRWKAGAYAKEAADCIEALTEQLEAARRDAKEAEAYAEELEARPQGKITGRMLHDIFVKRMAHAYVDEDPTELKGVCMDGYFNLIQIAEDIKSALREEKPND